MLNEINRQKKVHTYDSNYMNSRLIKTNIRGFAINSVVVPEGTDCERDRGDFQNDGNTLFIDIPSSNRLKDYSKDLSISLYVIFNLIWKYKYTYTHIYVYICKAELTLSSKTFSANIPFFFFFGSNIFYFHITGEDKDTIPLVREQFITLLIFYNSISIILNIL